MKHWKTVLKERRSPVCVRAFLGYLALDEEKQAMLPAPTLYGETDGTTCRVVGVNHRGKVGITKRLSEMSADRYVYIDELRNLRRERCP